MQIAGTSLETALRNAISGGYVAEMSGWLRDGRVQWDETVVDGLENAPAALIGMLAGENTGKMVVRVG